MTAAGDRARALIAQGARSGDPTVHPGRWHTWADDPDGKRSRCALGCGAVIVRPAH